MSTKRKARDKSPRANDAVLGSETPLQVDGVVLGGIEGVKQRLASTTVEQRLAALSDALNYGEAGLDLVLEALQDESLQVQSAAYFLLKDSGSSKVKQYLSNYLPWFEFDVVKVKAKRKKTRRYTKQAQFLAEDLGNGVTLEMVKIPSGTFLMGSLETEEMFRTESPQHQVTVKSFLMGKYPVTQAQWQAVAALPPVNTELEPNPSFFAGEDRPVQCVSWDEAVEFCTRLSQKTGRTYRLPSEAEWEYACRAGTTTLFHFGETINIELVNYAIYHDYDDGLYWPCSMPTEPTPVGSFAVGNDFGLYDMHGNVLEWCTDNWHDNYEGAPTDGSAWLDDNENRDWWWHPVLRGGSGRHPLEFCRSASRYYVYMSDKYVGFRVVCEVA